MNVTVINAFVDVTIRVLKTMAHIDAAASSPYLKKDNVAHGDVSGIVVFKVYFSAGNFFN